MNDVYQVFDTSGKALINPVDLNTLFGYAPAITRTGPNAGQEGPDVFDPSCLFDPQTGAFFVVASMLDRVGTVGPRCPARRTSTSSSAAIRRSR